MSLASRDPPTEHIQNSHFADRLVWAARRLVTRSSEGTIALSALVAFISVWMLFWTVSTASVDIHTDADEAAPLTTLVHGERIENTGCGESRAHFGVIDS